MLSFSNAKLKGSNYFYFDENAGCENIKKYS